MADKAVAITLEAPEGFTYVSWQRIIVRYEEADGDYCTQARWDIYNALSRLIDWGLPYKMLQLANDPWTLFVLSGESFTLQDFADVVAEATGRPVKIIDKQAEEYIRENDAGGRT